jgi:hypothetical protein
LKTFFFSPDVQAQFDSVEQRAQEFFDAFQMVSWDTRRGPWISLSITSVVCGSVGEEQPMPETQLCPRRVEGPFNLPETDTWSLDRWPSHPRLKTVRTCSYCGCTHPDDVLQLLREGWEHGATTKSYKGYIELPGTEAYQQAMTAWIQDGGLDKGKSAPAPLVDASMLMTGMPPIKFYIQHFSVGQVVELNSLISAQRSTMKGIGNA